MKKYRILLFLLPGILLTGCSIKKVEEITDAEKFAIEYAVQKDNPFVYLTAKEALEFVDTGTGIIYFGFPECESCQEILPLFDEILTEKQVDKIYYYNPKKIQSRKTKTYQKLIQQLEEKQKDIDDLEIFSFPDFYAFDKGKMVAHVNTFGEGQENVHGYLTNQAKKQIKKDLTKLVETSFLKECENCK